MKTGISSYTYTWAIGVPGHEPQNPLDANGLLQKAIDNSLSVVQIADNLPLHLLGKENLECHSAILELWTPPEASISQTIEKEDLWAIESIRYLKQIFT